MKQENKNNINELISTNVISSARKILSIDCLASVIIKERGYDVLKKRFFYVYSNEKDTNSDDCKRREFNDFKQYYNELKGEVFENSCYFGYAFSREELKLLNCNLDKINFKSYLNESLSADKAKLIREIKDKKIKKKAKFIVVKEYSLVFNKFIVKLYLDSETNEQYSSSFTSEYICDFINYLDGDLSNANLLMCEGIENIKGIPNIDLTGIKVRSEIAEILGIKNKEISINQKPLININQSLKIDLPSVNKNVKIINDEYNKKIYYVTDIHLEACLKNNNCKTTEDIDYYLQIFAKKISNDGNKIILVGGDISHYFSLYEMFVKILKKYKFKNNKIFFTLGNHELWSFKDFSIDEIVSRYKKLLQDNNIYLVHNNMYIINDSDIVEVTPEELKIISNADLIQKAEEGALIIFGGIGYSGNNLEFNADNRVYMDTLNRDNEIELSNEFAKMYNKVISSLSDKNIVILTHMPVEDWTEKPVFKNNFVYINGHSHNNYFYDDGVQRLFCNNQIGYYKNNIELKYFFMIYGYNPFSKIEDGIYKIPIRKYKEFYRGQSLELNFNIEKPVYMIKKEGLYMFFIKNNKEQLLILDGGQKKKCDINELDYYYNNITNYANSIKSILKKYYTYQKKISKEIKKIGGNGSIHGCIIDIDKYNHLYTNPIDGRIYPYVGYSKEKKYVFANVSSLLKFELPSLFDNLINLIDDNNRDALLIVQGGLSIVDEIIYEPSTDMYKISELFIKLQYIIKNGIIRIWDEEFIEKMKKNNSNEIIIK